MPHTLAAVFAHPDDEVFSMGGTIALHTRRGGSFAVFCATPGDAGGRSGLPVTSRAELGALRRAELVEALRVLGASDVVFGDRADGALPEADADRLVGDIVRFLRERRPDVVVTFGPEGAPTGHRDHRAISRAATAAFLVAGRSTEYAEQLAEGLAPHSADRLYYASWPTPPLDQANRHEALPATACIDTRATHDVELRAFLAHRSQLDHIGPFRRDSLTPTEDFTLVTGAAQPRPIVDDLFAGLPEPAEEPAARRGARSADARPAR
jgi:LmbE family N-acetylglucosaminyl deacetylase